ncbi:hypothetical protein [uncultured Dysgonomonas sp.]|uniref:Uncharacterized protein n=1 Tax=uncultured Dysgonomonas sp. TaxID=206096 RepID=A0A212K0M4_9BACT|nr:hypothetical protein [uncultured Dysgonomonas sp.]SBW05178.1 conserved exported hypothetical protein [uncultured Dysgonomonas sp.]
MKTTVLKPTIFAVLVLIAFTTIKAQSAYTEIYPHIKVAISSEKLNTSQYSSKFKGSILDYTETKTDGTQIQAKAYRRNSNIEIFERPAYPAIHTVYKEFYPNGNLKQKGVLLPLQVKVGKWIECDALGNCSIIDHESGRNAFGYNDVLEYLEFEGVYNKTDGNIWKCTFWYTPESKTWGVRVDKDGQQYKMFNFDSTGQEEVKEFDLSGNSNSATPVGSFEQNEDTDGLKNRTNR